jgi:hypothetical protein
MHIRVARTLDGTSTEMLLGAVGAPVVLGGVLVVLVVLPAILTASGLLAPA